jgi:hypothetical protein
MGIYGNKNNGLAFQDEMKMIREDEIDDLLADADSATDDKADDKDDKKKKPKDPAKVSKKDDKLEDGDDKEAEVTNPSIEIGEYFVTVNLENKKVQIEDLENVNKVELTFSAFKKIVALYNKSDTRPEKKEDPMGGL